MPIGDIYRIPSTISETRTHLNERQELITTTSNNSIRWETDTMLFIDFTQSRSPLKHQADSFIGSHSFLIIENQGKESLIHLTSATRGEEEVRIRCDYFRND